MRGVTHFFGNFGLAHLFQLTRLMRGVTVRKAYITNANKFQLTRLMRGVTYFRIIGSILNDDFNSHASCEA